MRKLYQGSEAPESMQRCIECLDEFIELIHESSLNADRADIRKYRLEVDVTEQSRWVSVEVWRTVEGRHEVTCVALDVVELGYATRVPYLAEKAAKIYTAILSDTLRKANRA